MKKVIVITGASTGIGRNTAIKLAKLGHSVYGLSRNTELMEDLKAYGIFPMQVDITSPQNITQVIQSILTKESDIDVLINNAGYGFYESLEECPINKAKALFDINVFALMQMTQAVLPTMRNSKSGTIINISSVVGKVTLPFMGWYSATKHAVEGLSDSLRMELKAFNIKVVIVEPGRIRSKFGHTALSLSNLNPVSPYYKPMIKFQDLINNNPFPSAHPNSISNTIIKIINSSNPKARYSPNFDAKIILFLKKWFEDKFIDWLIGYRL